MHCQCKATYANTIELRNVCVNCNAAKGRRYLRQFETHFVWDDSNVITYMDVLVSYIRLSLIFVWKPLNRWDNVCMYTYHTVNSKEIVLQSWHVLRVHWDVVRVINAIAYTMLRLHGVSISVDRCATSTNSFTSIRLLIIVPHLYSDLFTQTCFAKYSLYKYSNVEKLYRWNNCNYITNGQTIE